MLTACDFCFDASRPSVAGRTLSLCCDLKSTLCCSISSCGVWIAWWCSIFASWWSCSKLSSSSLSFHWLPSYWNACCISFSLQQSAQLPHRHHHLLLVLPESLQRFPFVLNHEDQLFQLALQFLHPRLSRAALAGRGINPRSCSRMCSANISISFSCILRCCSNWPQLCSQSPRFHLGCTFIFRGSFFVCQKNNSKPESKGITEKFFFSWQDFLS